MILVWEIQVSTGIHWTTHTCKLIRGAEYSSPSPTQARHDPTMRYTPFYCDEEAEYEQFLNDEDADTHTLPYSFPGKK
jgi:hypothetical protein